MVKKGMMFLTRIKLKTYSYRLTPGTLNLKRTLLIEKITVRGPSISRVKRYIDCFTCT